MAKPTNYQLIAFVLILLVTNGATALVAHHTDNKQTVPRGSTVTNLSSAVHLSFGDTVQKTVNNLAPHLNEPVSLAGSIARLPSGTRDYILSQPSAPNFGLRLDFSNSGLSGDSFINKKQSHTVIGVLKFDTTKNSYYIIVSSVK